MMIILRKSQLLTLALDFTYMNLNAILGQYGKYQISESNRKKSMAQIPSLYYID